MTASLSPDQPAASAPPTNGPDRPSIAPWRFWLPLALQLALVILVPARSAYTYFTGQTIILQTRPIDPYDLLRGYSQTLSYEVSSIDQLAKVPGWSRIASATPSRTPTIDVDVKTFYVILAQPQPAPAATPMPTASPSPKPQASGNKPYGPKPKQPTIADRGPKPWTAVEIWRSRPENVPSDRAILQATVQGGNNITYGLETYYMPEDRRDEVNTLISRARWGDLAVPTGQRQTRPFVVEVRVDREGHGVPIALWIGDEAFRF